MLNNSDYTALLKDLAERHKSVCRVDGKRVFTKVIVSADPVAKQVNLTTFYALLKDSFGERPFVVAMSYDTVHEDKGDGAMLAHRRGGFMVLAKAKNTEAGRDLVLDATQTIGYQLMAAVAEAFRGPVGRRAGRMLNLGSLAVDSIGPVGDGFTGTRFEFDFTESATLALQHDATHFNPAP
ncbi:hypothetical protein Q5H92_22940 [Hymenobacter sp. M29]|uniref:Uncharacterized protein n=1 Tax=Hymenobacter mellowenesis TaxID=3063995 RepID=A0ABT9AH91_9BACT|nr:hypothetical protein [Hymenobacter sp. M29]MDO7849239.1 hypothetical protein [Hymenobacter sp. M29]